jgi:CheY-like chemotaxis protein
LLLIEDNQDVRDSLVELLSVQGIEVRAAADGLEGLQMLRSGLRPKAVLLDRWMPRLDGAGVLTAMTRDERLASIPVVWMSGDVAEPPADVSARLEKPFTVEELLDVLRSLNDAG